MHSAWRVSRFGRVVNCGGTKLCTHAKRKVWELRVAAARGENTPISPMGWLRIVMRALALVLLLLVFVPLHYLYRLFKYGSPFPMLFLRYAARICGCKVKRQYHSRRSQ